jgi:hypothetical protein
MVYVDDRVSASDREQDYEFNTAQFHATRNFSCIGQYIDNNTFLPTINQVDFAYLRISITGASVYEQYEFSQVWQYQRMIHRDLSSWPLPERLRESEGQGDGRGILLS